MQAKTAWTLLVLPKATNVEAYQTCQAGFKTPKTAPTGQETKKDVVLEERKTLEARETPNSLQHTCPWKTH